jgi:large subunit ribosomal protein L4
VKTKQITGLLKALNLKGLTCLVGTAEYDRNTYLSARNIPEVEVMPTSQFNAYTVLRQKRLVLTKAALEELRNPSKPAPAK